MFRYRSVMFYSLMLIPKVALITYRRPTHLLSMAFALIFGNLIWHIFASVCLELCHLIGSVSFIKLRQISVFIIISVYWPLPLLTPMIGSLIHLVTIGAQFTQTHR